ncbi:MAG: TIGR02757 family protein [Sphingobacteriales bacterium]|uniref:TIGR02757 family protein n=1 Tax=Hydrotalea flava TaxID=714549 RepID=UPI00082D780B|nr:TIGR02757 family protein [Hydrotalea flava]RTL56924.1 MAG: TIGR02757 family protein [Sphingobacteriales bacterium]
MPKKSTYYLKDFLDSKVAIYNRPDFIPGDPISVPHRYTQKQDIEIAGLFAALFSWGNRTAIIQKSITLMQLMDDAPYDFICNHQPADLKKLMEFQYRTFNTTDLLYTISFLQQHYQQYQSLEPAFSQWGPTVADMLNGFHHYFFSLEDAPTRTRKHIAAPEKKSACKRLNMYLRWMVRKDNIGVDFGIWKELQPAQLICPLDLHVARVAKRLNMIHRKQTDWLTAIELTDYLRNLDATDPVKYDFALFGLGIIEKY